LQAVIGRLQLRKYNEWVKVRRSTAERFNNAFAELPALRVTLPPREVYHSYYKYYVFVRPEKLKNGWSRDRIMEEVSAAGVPCFTGSCGEIYREKAFDISIDGKPLRPAERFPVAKELEETSLMLLCHNTLTEANISDTIKVVGEIVTKATF
ncbi:MAG: DegT/DnrJ/EryC1/StrS family aminotransferase, partial [Candidatus Riflebacteria bacterium]